MKINKEIISKLPRDYVFITGTFDLDAPYFKKRIEEGVKVSSLNYKTNVHGQRTEWKFFNKDEKLGLFFLHVIDYIDNLNLDIAVLLSEVHADPIAIISALFFKLFVSAAKPITIFGLSELWLEI